MQLSYDKDQHCYQCHGVWTISHLDNQVTLLTDSNFPVETTLKINGKGLEDLDSAGALLISNFANNLKNRGKTVELVDFTKEQLSLFKLVESKRDDLDHQPKSSGFKGVLFFLGEETIRKYEQLHGLVSLIGDLSIKIMVAVKNVRRFRFPGIMSNINSAGLQALPIVGLLSFLIGIVLAYQMGLQLETYGANIFIAYLSGAAIFREFAPLITAIIVAGRTSSAFTAQIGSMKINEELDALQTMGLSPTELLVLPKVIAMLLVFPLLIFWSDVFGILGAMFMSKSMLDIHYIDFMMRVRDSVGLKTMMLGLYKAPAFALIIAIVGCFQGFLVKASADSVGSQTTKSVVQALFLIIIADAAFSIIYSWLNV